MVNVSDLRTGALLVATVAVILLGGVTGLNCKGCTPLDNLTFDKILKQFSVSLIKFDVAYPYGEKHEEFAKVAEDAASMQELFVGEVGIKDYGDKDNEDLAQRFDVKKEDYPVVIIFVNKKDGSELQHFRFDNADFTSESLKAFLRKHTGFHLPLKGCIESLDGFAERMMAAGADAYEAILKEVQETIDSFSDEDKKKANTYLKIMNKIVSDGADFVVSETKRVKKLLENRMTELKKSELLQRINVLRSFPVITDKAGVGKHEL